MGQLLPFHHVLTYCMAPGHVSPFIGLWVMLKKEVILPIVIDHAVGVIEPVFTGGEMELGAVLLVIPNIEVRREGLHVLCWFFRCTQGRAETGSDKSRQGQ